VDEYKPLVLGQVARSDSREGGEKVETVDAG
jgi:hypothetical protein